MTDEMRPPINRAMRTLDRSFFKQIFPISAARLSNNQDISSCRSILSKSKDMLTLERFPSVQPDPDIILAQQGRKCLLLRPDIKPDGTRAAPCVQELG